jgi:hypothetical protein
MEVEHHRCRLEAKGGVSAEVPTTLAADEEEKSAWLHL